MSHAQQKHQVERHQHFLLGQQSSELQIRFAVDEPFEVVLLELGHGRFVCVGRRSILLLLGSPGAIVTSVARDSAKHQGTVQGRDHSGIVAESSRSGY
jgi:hypothetical protein